MERTEQKMTERELFKRAVSENFLEKTQSSPTPLALYPSLVQYQEVHT